MPIEGPPHYKLVCLSLALFSRLLTYIRLNHDIKLMMRVAVGTSLCTANLRTKILYFREFDSSVIFISRDRIPRPIGGDFPEIRVNQS